MVNSRRQALKREFDYLLDRNQKNIDKLVELANLYGDEHTDYRDMMFRLATYLDNFRDPAIKVRDII